ncbi:MAG: uracil-DNA glycosylase [Spirochaetes bacterium]|nr:uracil-DNA glycosylase [Spirochaetota bacterium]
MISQNNKKAFLEIITDFRSMLLQNNKHDISRKIKSEQTNNNNSQSKLMSLEKEAEMCRKCEIAKARKNMVFGAGNPEADLMLIGEAPGYYEDIQGKPFVGKAGQLLNKMFEAINFKRSSLYIANTLKCRPPDNRNPQPTEIENCIHFLEKQIEIIKPKMICTLGKYAAQTILRTDESISRLRGKLLSYNGIPVIPIYHPSYLLRNPSAKKETWGDLKVIRKKIDEL